MSETFSRRRFLGLAGFGVLWVTLDPFSGWSNPVPSLIEVLTRRFLPGFVGSRPIPEGFKEVWRRLSSAVPVRLSDELALSLRLLDRSPVTRLSMHRFARTSVAVQEGLLDAWQTGNWGVCRKAFMAWQRVVLMGAFGARDLHPRIHFDGPWVGRLDVGLGLDNQADMVAPLNAGVFAAYPGPAGL
jgi:hypothetical protein